MTNRIAEIAERYKDDRNAIMFAPCISEDMLFLLSQLAEREREIERLREAIASVHKSLDFADTQRQSSKNYTELAINNGLALGQIAVALKHDFKEPEEGAEK